MVHFLTGEQFLWFIYFYYCLTSKIGRRVCRNFRGWKFIFQSSSVWKSVTKRKILQNFRWKMKNATLFFHWSYTHITQQESSYAPSRRGSHCSGLVLRFDGYKSPRPIKSSAYPRMNISTVLKMQWKCVLVRTNVEFFSERVIFT